VSPMVVPMMQGLDDDDARVQDDGPLSRAARLMSLIGRDIRGDLDQLVAAVHRMFPQCRDSGERHVALVDLRLASTQTPDVPLFRRQHMKESRSNRPVCPWSTHLQLLLREVGANIEQMQVRPLVVAERLDQQRLHDAPIVRLVSCQGMALDTLATRSRHLALFERYGALLTEHQQEVLDLSLRSDWSLAEISGHQGTSRAAVHDIVRRSTDALEEFERRLGLLAEAGRRRRKVASLERELAGLKKRLVELEA